MQFQAQVFALLANQQHCYSIADRECVYAQFQPYQHVLAALAAMPNSPIEPNSIIETWHTTAHGIAIAVECIVAQQKIMLWIPRQSDFLDLRWLAQLNQYCAPMHFLWLEAEEQALIVLATTAEQTQINQILAASIRSLGLDVQQQSLLATAEQRLDLHDYQGLIDQISHLLTIEATAPLYALLGRAYYESGQIDAAWQAWADAAQLGEHTIYAAMQAMYQIY